MTLRIKPDGYSLEDDEACFKIQFETYCFHCQEMTWKDTGQVLRLKLDEKNREPVILSARLENQEETI